MMTLDMIGALERMHAWNIHCKGALNTGVTQDEIRVILQMMGTPAACHQRWTGFA